MNEISYNLIDDPWIPCTLNSTEVKMLGIKDVLFKADEISEISSDNPLIVISIYRLLLAILHRNFGPKDRNEWIAIYQAGKWDREILNQYFKKWNHRFELFNESENRFYQIDISNIMKKKTVVTKLDYALSSGNNPALFDHHWDSDITPMSVEYIAQLLLSYQNYSLSGLGGFLYIGEKKERDHYYFSPLISGIIVLLKGGDLFETLMLNFVRYDHNHPFKKSEAYEDIPYWERDNKSLNMDKKGRLPYGYLDYLTWQSRRIWLIPYIEDEQINVKYVLMAQGEKVKSDWNLDPQKVYKIDKENKKAPLKLNPDRQVWRDAEALLRLNTSGSKFISPKAINWVSTLIQRGLISLSKRYNLEIYGMCNDPSKVAKIISWHRSSIPLPLKYLEDPTLVDNIKSFIEKCEKIEKILNTTIYLFAKEYLFPDKTSLNTNQKNKLNDFTKGYQIPIRYWNFVENYFYKFMGEIAQEPDTGKRQTITRDWINNYVIKTARDILNTIKINFRDDPRALKPLIQNTGYFFKNIHNLKQ